MAKYARVADNFRYDEELSPHENLAAAIIRRAVMDARRINDGRDLDHGDLYRKGEITRFFNSRWCDILLCTTTLSGEDIRKAVGW